MVKRIKKYSLEDVLEEIGHDFLQTEIMDKATYTKILGLFHDKRIEEIEEEIEGLQKQKKNLQKKKKNDGKKSNEVEFEYDCGGKCEGECECPADSDSSDDTGDEFLSKKLSKKLILDERMRKKMINVRDRGDILQI